MKRMDSATFQRLHGPAYRPGSALRGARNVTAREVPRTAFVNYSGKVPSINSCYSTGRNGRRFLTKAGKDFKRYVTNYVAHFIPGSRIIKSDWYVMQVVFSLPLKCNNGERRKWDVTNHIKLLEDAMCEALGIDDSQIIRVISSKVDGAWGCTANIEATAL